MAITCRASHVEGKDYFYLLETDGLQIKCIRPYEILSSTATEMLAIVVLENTNALKVRLGTAFIYGGVFPEERVPRSPSG